MADAPIPRCCVERGDSGAHRPLLDDDRGWHAAAMDDEREPLYREVADAIVTVDGRHRDEIAERGPRDERHVQPCHVDLGRPQPYDVLVGHGARRRARLAAPADGAAGGARHAGRHPARCRPGRRRTSCSTIGHGEEHKSLATIERPVPRVRRDGPDPQRRRDRRRWRDGHRRRRLRRRRWHRGVPVVHVATTLLGMVDAAIGGKTGVNLPEGKNLVGAFWQPSGVVCDLDALRHAAAARDALRLRRDGEVPLPHRRRPAGDGLDRRIARCVEIKAEVVAADEREGGRRALLNYGHTLAHALEIATEHRLAHGEAVAIGLSTPPTSRGARPHRRRRGSTSTTRSSADAYELPTDAAGRRRRRALLDADGPRQEGARRADVRARRPRRRRGRRRRRRAGGAAALCRTGV